MGYEIAKAWQLGKSSFDRGFHSSNLEEVLAVLKECGFIIIPPLTGVIHGVIWSSYALGRGVHENS